MDLFAISLTDFSPLEDHEKWFPGLYAMLDEKGECLYIGESSDVPRRIGEHRRKKKWFPDVDQVLGLVIPGASDRLIAETVLQLRTFPRYCGAVKIGFSWEKKAVHSLQFIRTRRAIQ